MLVRITKKQATRLLQETNQPKEHLQHAKKVNPVHLTRGTHLTYLRSDQSPDGREGYHLQIPGS